MEILITIYRWTLLTVVTHASKLTWLRLMAHSSLGLVGASSSSSFLQDSVNSTFILMDFTCHR